MSTETIALDGEGKREEETRTNLENCKRSKEFKAGKAEMVVREKGKR